MAMITVEMLEQQNEEMGVQNGALRHFRKKIEDSFFDEEDTLDPVNQDTWQEMQDALCDKIDYWIRANTTFQRMNERIIRRMYQMAQEEIYGFSELTD